MTNVTQPPENNDRLYVVLGVLALVVLGGISAAAFYAGDVPTVGGDAGGAASDGGSDSATTDFPTATAGEESGSAADSAPPAFSFTVDRIEECGQTCRDVTVTLTNNLNDTETDVTVFTRIYSGQDNTESGDLVWERRREVGTLGAGESQTTTVRIELSFQDAFKIQSNGGWITVLTTIQSDDETVTHRGSQQVA